MGAERHLLGFVDLLFDESTVTRPKIMGILLQDTLAGLIADRAIEGVIDQDEFQHAFTGLFDLGRFGEDDHAIGGDGRAGRHGLGHLLHLHQAHPAVGFHLEFRVITKIRYLNPQPFGGLDNIRPRIDCDVAIIDLHRRHRIVLNCRFFRGHRLCATAY